MKLGSTTTHLSSIVMLSLVLAGLAPSGALAQSQSDEWQWRGTIYGWFPGVNGTANLPTGGSTNVETDISDILDALDFTFMGTLEARKGRWGGLVDLIYLDLSNSKSGSRSFNFSGPGGVINIPADASLNASVGLKSWVWTLAGTYTVVEKPGYEMLLLGGARYLKVDINLDWQATGNVGPLPPLVRAGNASAKPDYWDAIIGVRGRADLGQSKWYIPYYFDIGKGNCDRTWQAAAGIGYRFNWGELTAVYRYLDCKFKAGGPMQDIAFGGPAIGASWRW